MTTRSEEKLSMFLHNKSQIAVAAGFIALGGLAIAGWLHRTEQPASAAVVPAPYGAPAVSDLQPAPTAQPASTVQSPSNVAPPDDDEPGVSSDGYYGSINQPVYVNPAEPPAPPPPTAQYAPPPPDHGYYSPEYRRRHHRSRAKSIAIVAGSAGVGAAIGAIAGGGPGAAIGAIAGGTGGFIYDRSTHH